MTVIQIIDAFTFYGLDVIALAALTSVCVQLLKKSAFKNCKKKVMTFLPFVLGCIFYAAYAAIINADCAYIVKNYVLIIEHGFSVGALSTVIYVWYEQFIREKSAQSATESVIATLIEGYVPSEKVETVAAAIASAIEKDVTGDGANKAAELLSENAGENVNENDVKLLARLIVETLAHIAATS